MGFQKDNDIAESFSCIKYESSGHASMAVVTPELMESIKRPIMIHLPGTSMEVRGEYWKWTKWTETFEYYKPSEGDFTSNFCDPGQWETDTCLLYDDGSEDSLNPFVGTGYMGGINGDVYVVRRIVNHAIGAYKWTDYKRSSGVESHEQVLQYMDLTRLSLAGLQGAGLQVVPMPMFAENPNEFSYLVRSVAVSCLE